MRDIKLDHLHNFAKVVETGAFSRAATKLNLTQPAVSLQVRHLEKRLVVRLLERIGKRVTTTPAGTYLLPPILQDLKKRYPNLEISVKDWQYI